jgi:asparagine synthase (glutamine-hydrolysing)
MEELERMASTLAHRGPDAWGTYISNGVALGHTRLSIVDLAGGHQPMKSDDLAIVYNGELFNYLELKQELSDKGVHFETTSDTEVVLKAYQFYGTAAFQKFNGQYAILIWNNRTKQLTIVRDRFGMRPLYILEHNRQVYFSSEMKAFDTIEGFQRSYNMDHLFEHALLWNTLHDDTVYDNIRSLPGGTYEIYEAGRIIEQARYYDIGESYCENTISFDDAKDEFRDILEDSVKLRLRSDVPVGAYLSGGIDSSVTSYLASIHNNKQTKTFSVAFEDKEFDESGYQLEMSRQLNTDHHCQMVDYQSINDNFMDAVYHMERPVFRTAGVPLFLLSKAVNENNIKVVLTGEGADEILFGYDSYKELKMMQFWNRNPESTLRPQLIKRLYPHLRHYSDPQKYGMLRMYYEEFLPEYDNELSGLNIRAHNNKVVGRYFHKDRKVDFNRDATLEKIRSRLPSNFYRWSILQQNQYMEMKTLLPGYLLSSQGDRMSMAHSLEGRYPFLDHRVVEKVFSYKCKYKLNGFRQKHLLSEAFKKEIPASIINRPKKPYTAPDLKAFYPGGKLSEMARHFMSPEMIQNYGIFDEKFTERLIRKFSSGIPAEIGYRDNMLFTFILSCQITNHWIRNPKTSTLDRAKKTVEITDH